MPSTCYDAMDREELVRLAGEQALLSRELRDISSQHERNKVRLHNLTNDIGRSPDWFERGTDLLQQLRDAERKLADGYQRVRELSKLTGIQ